MVQGESLTALAFVTFQRILGKLPLTAAEMGLDWELSVNYVENIEITIELSQFQPLFVQSWQESWENSTLDVSSSLQNVNAGIFERSQKLIRQ